MGTFVSLEQDPFNPQYGEVDWKRRLDLRLEATGVELVPIGYQEADKPVMPINQENCAIYINQVADELDVVAVRYDQDETDLWTFYFRERFEGDDEFAHVVSVVGPFATQIITMYPMEHVVRQYEAFQDASIPDCIPEDFGV